MWVLIDRQDTAQKKTNSTLCPNCTCVSWVHWTLRYSCVCWTRSCSCICCRGHRCHHLSWSDRWRIIGIGWRSICTGFIAKARDESRSNFNYHRWRHSYDKEWRCKQITRAECTVYWLWWSAETLSIPTLNSDNDAATTTCMTECWGHGYRLAGTKSLHEHKGRSGNHSHGPTVDLPLPTQPASYSPYYRLVRSGPSMSSSWVRSTISGRLTSAKFRRHTWPRRPDRL